MSCVVLSLHNREEPHVSRGKANRGFGEQSRDYHRNQRKNGSLRVSRARKRVVVRRQRQPGASAPAALNSPNETDRKTLGAASGGNQMGRTLTAFVVAASLLPLASSEASAWVCRAIGLGSSGYARAYDIIDAKLFALRQCERRSPLPVCTLVWCRPGG